MGVGVGVQYIKIFLVVFVLFSTAITFANNATWMSQIPNQRIMNQLIIPGTHDSGTYGIQPQSKFSLSPDDPLPLWIEAISNILPISIVRPIVAGWSKTQFDSITDQLNNGIRYLDFRVCLYQSHFYLCHALLSIRLREALQQIHHFIAANPSEIILLDINHVYNVMNSAEETQLVQLIQYYLGNNEIPNTYHVTDTIGTLRASHKNVIILMDAQQSVANPFWPESTINSPWPNASTINDLKNTLDIEMSLRDKIYQSANNFFVLQVIQTENTDNIINGIINPTHYPNTIADFEIPVNNALIAWLNGYIAEYGSNPINIVIQDWYSNHSELVSLAEQYDTQFPPQKNNADNADTQSKLAALKKWYLHK
ncbi:MAG: hypothetical protein A3C44_06160 [Gammaproteobacteria bacterium RIFCSPHIGHO2_02_FULL_39_13]|nr:MAG: hypothetical protein A3C44_06160 [Gammaproteobacteria bacterium RIFCSPHIGHO2_02_FULL_39_13]OGT49265.1 MAG: hypothetical protein A3E53_07380 [Gammaproteobacteria bacterium RIFCSPHIGHO2_12_FULL_39_24]